MKALPTEPTWCTVPTAKGKPCRNVAHYLYLRPGVKVSSNTNLRGHVHVTCSQHRAHAERLLGLRQEEE